MLMPAGCRKFCTSWASWAFAGEVPVLSVNDTDGVPALASSALAWATFGLSYLSLSPYAKWLGANGELPGVAVSPNITLTSESRLTSMAIASRTSFLSSGGCFTLNQMPWNPKPGWLITVNLLSCLRLGTSLEGNVSV